MQFRSHARTPALKGQTICATNIAGQSSLKPMIRRLEAALGRRNLDESLILLARPPKVPVTLLPNTKVTNFVVGYSGSAHSQSALDLALCIAHQTRLVKPDPVVVHVVYVVDQTLPKMIAMPIAFSGKLAVWPANGVVRCMLIYGWVMSPQNSAKWPEKWRLMCCCWAVTPPTIPW